MTENNKDRHRGKKEKKREEGAIVPESGSPGNGEGVPFGFGLVDDDETPLQKKDADLVSQAFRERWCIPPEIRRTLGEKAVRMLNNATNHRQFSQCARILTDLERINIEAEKMERGIGEQNMNMTFDVIIPGVRDDPTDKP